ncbi:MAG: hypothetical protein Q9187_001299 [Circinaria calcarea]
MNLGSVHLNTVNTSKPHLAHTPSKQSVAASDDYYSFSDHASEVSAESDRTTIVRYRTPPSQMRSPNTSRDLLQVQHAQPMTGSEENLDMERRTPRTARFDNEAILRNPEPTARNSRTWRPSVSEVSPPTPGVDDTPYIQFAIDQLTRDEELLGRRRQRAGSEDSFSEHADGQFELSTAPPIPPINPNRIRAASDLEDGMPPSAEDRQMPNCPIPTREQLHASEPLGPQPIIPQAQTSLAAADNTPIVHNNHPADPSPNVRRYPKLDFLPSSLRLPSVLGLIFCCILMIAALIFCSAWSSKNNGLWQYDGVGTSRYFVFEFLPQILASIIVIWTLVIQRAVHRILPFTLLASDRPKRSSGYLYNIATVQTNFMIPNLSFLKHGEPLVTTALVLLWLGLFTIPLQSSLFQTRLYTLSSQGVWIWSTVQPIAWVLIVLYFYLIIALILLYLRFARTTTGLKWDPVSLADIFVLLQRSDALSASDVPGDGLPDLQKWRNLRLGYWTRSSRLGEAFYGIGEDHEHVSYPDREKDNGTGSGQEGSPLNPTGVDLESQRPGHPSSAMRYLYIPWFLSETWVVAWMVIAIVLLIAFLVVSFVNRAVQNGFPPGLPAPTTSLGFSPANFLYSFIPSLLSMILFLFWQSIDVTFRTLEPFANLAKSDGAVAQDSLLLDYGSGLPVVVTVKAALARHYKVAWVSFVGLMSITLPILAGGVFTAQFFVGSQSVREAACVPAYNALVVFVVIYALSFLVIWPTRKRYLPYNIRVLGNIISLGYPSSLCGDAAFRDPHSRIDLVTRLLSRPKGQREDRRFAFGAFRARDGREAWGVDTAERLDGRDMVTAAGQL